MYSSARSTLRASVDPETAQTLLSGMGERHLEVVVDRMERDFGLTRGDIFHGALGLDQLFMARPMLGIRTEDLDGQLGAYFGAPENEGVLVTHVNTGSLSP